MAEIKRGDVVRLKSGGPLMTVGPLNSIKTMWNCDWFDGTESMCDLFIPEALVLVPSDEVAAGQGGELVQEKPV